MAQHHVAPDDQLLAKALRDAVQGIEVFGYNLIAGPGGQAFLGKLGSSPNDFVTPGMQVSGRKQLGRFTVEIPQDLQGFRMRGNQAFPPFVRFRFGIVEVGMLRGAQDVVTVAKGFDLRR